MRYSSNIRMSKGELSLANPYFDLYKSFNLQSGESCNRQDAESIVRHMGFMHNAFGEIIKDFINVIKYKFVQTEQSNSEEMAEEISEKESPRGQRGEEVVEVQNIKWREQYNLQEMIVPASQLNSRVQEFTFVQEIQARPSSKTLSNNKVLPKVNAFNPALFQYKPQISHPPPNRQNKNFRQDEATIKKKDPKFINLDDQDVV